MKDKMFNITYNEFSSQVHSILPFLIFLTCCFPFFFFKKKKFHSLKCGKRDYKVRKLQFKAL